MNKVSENPLKNRTEQLSPFVVVSVLFILCYVVSNLMAVKVVGFFGLFYFDAGTITFPLAYMLGDVLTEIWGYKTAKKTIILAFLCNLFVVACTQIGVCSGDGYAREQLINQLRKIVNVKKVEVLESDCIKRELMLIKIKNDRDQRTDVSFACEVYRAKVVDYNSEKMCIEVTGDPSKIDAFVELMKPYGIIEMCRTGIVALDRGSLSLLEKNT